VIVLVFALVSLLFVIVGALVLARRPADFGGGGAFVAPSILILVVASVVAATAWPKLRTAGFCDVERLGGANIAHAVELALLCGIVGSVTLRAVRSDLRRVAVVLLVAAVVLSICLALVSLDSATYTVLWFPPSGDMFNCPEDTVPEVHRVWYLYPVWGSAAALLLLQAVRAFRYARLLNASQTGSGENDEDE